MIDLLKNEKPEIVIDLNKNTEIKELTNLPDDFLLITNKRLIERKQSNLQWEYNIIHISDINQIKITRGLDITKISFGFLGLIISYPLMNLIEN